PNAGTSVPVEHAAHEGGEPLPFRVPRRRRSVVALPDDRVVVPVIDAHTPRYDRLILVHEHQVRVVAMEFPHAEEVVVDVVQIASSPGRSVVGPDGTRQAKPQPT